MFRERELTLRLRGDIPLLIDVRDIVCRVHDNQPILGRQNGDCAGIWVNI